MAMNTVDFNTLLNEIKSNPEMAAQLGIAVSRNERPALDMPADTTKAVALIKQMINKGIEAVFSNCLYFEVNDVKFNAEAVNSYVGAQSKAGKDYRKWVGTRVAACIWYKQSNGALGYLSISQHNKAAHPEADENTVVIRRKEWRVGARIRQEMPVVDTYLGIYNKQGVKIADAKPLEYEKAVDAFESFGGVEA